MSDSISTLCLTSERAAIGAVVVGNSGAPNSLDGLWRRRCWSVAWTQGTLLALGLVTWPLWWTGETTNGSFPQVPALSLWRSVPTWIDSFLALGMVAVLVGQVFLSLRSGLAARPASWDVQPIGERWLFGLTVAFLVGLALLVLGNQHRLQPWAYLAWWLALMGIVGQRFVGSNDQGLAITFRFWRWLVISVYFFSALSKFDVTFLQTLGSVFLTTLWGSLPGLDPPQPESWPLAVLLVFPVGELGLALALASGRYPRCCVALAIGMHSALLWILGPWGLDHQPGVWIWNVFFIGQVGLLFWPLRGATLAVESWSSLQRSWPAVAILSVPLLLPWLQPFGACDHWMAWELYAPRGARIQVFLAAPLRETTNEWTEFLEPEPDPQWGLVWHELRMDQWSLRRLGAPIYPEDRFQLGVALAVAERLERPDWLLVQWHGPADRWTGHRESRLLRSPRELEQFATRYRVNVRPR